MKWFKILIGPLLFLICLTIGGFDHPQVKMVAIMLWMLSWWVTNALPVGATALVPILLFPLLGILNLKETTANYANPVIFLFMGGFILGLAIEKWNLHKRIALNIMNLSGDKPNRIILGGMLATALLSMWISNTATAVMMLPIGMSVVALLGEKLAATSGRNFGITLMVGIAYAANLGGITTLIGTPPNLVLASIVEESGMPSISFANWLFFAFPLVAILFTLTYFINTKMVFPVKIKRIEGIKSLISKELTTLGALQGGEKRVLIIMAFTACLWIFRAQLTQLTFLKDLSDTGIAILASLLLFVVPSGDKSRPQALLNWDDTKKLPWGILLLFGGGISLAKGMEATDIVGIVGQWISNTGLNNTLLIILLVCSFSVFLTEVMSNVAMVSVFIPVSFVIAKNLGLAEMDLAVPLTIGASCAFMFPISTPPNAIVFSSGYLKMNDMAKTGIWVNLTSILIISIYCWLFQSYFI